MHTHSQIHTHTSTPPYPLTHWFSHGHIYFITHPHTPIYTPFSTHTLTRVSPLNSSHTHPHTHTCSCTCPHVHTLPKHILSHTHKPSYIPSHTRPQSCPPFLHVASHNPSHTHRPTQPSHVYTPHTLTNAPPDTPIHTLTSTCPPTASRDPPYTATSSCTHVLFSQTVIPGLHAAAPSPPRSG